jgi:hypothetical protein
MVSRDLVLMKCIIVPNLRDERPLELAGRNATNPTPALSQAFAAKERDNRSASRRPRQPAAQFALALALRLRNPSEV